MEFGLGVLAGCFGMVLVLSFVMDTPADTERRHELFSPLCAKELSALECEALWQGIEVKP